MAEQAAAEHESPRTATFNVLFVCTGNTCRSPLAEAITRAELAARGWPHVRVASAGLAAYDGAAASPEAMRVAARHGVDLSGHRSRSLTPELLGWADLVLAMGPSHLAGLERYGATDRAALLGDFAAGKDGAGAAVRDPYGGGDEVYEETFRELRRLIPRALDRLRPILAP